MDIKITKKEITGVNNPLLHLEGNIKNKDFNIKIKSNRKEIDYILQKFPATGDFILDAKLSNEDKLIKFYFNNKEIIDIKNTKIKRIINKIKGKINRPLSTLKVIFITL